MSMWKVAPNGDVCTRIENLRVVIRETSGFTRFMLMACQASGANRADVLLESGSEDNLRMAQDRAVTRALALAHRGR